MHLDQEKEMDTQEAVKAFLTHAKARGLSHNTVQAYRWALNHITCDNLPDEPGGDRIPIGPCCPTSGAGEPA